MCEALTLIAVCVTLGRTKVWASRLHIIFQGYTWYPYRPTWNVSSYEKGWVSSLTPHPRGWVIGGVASEHIVAYKVAKLNLNTQEYPKHACKEFLSNFDKFGFSEDAVPQLEDMAQVLKVKLVSSTATNVRPCHIRRHGQVDSPSTVCLCRLRDAFVL